MGDTYSFEKVKRENFLNGKSRFVMDKDGWCIEDYNPDYHTVVCDLDREDFLYRLVKPADGFADGDRELADFLKNKYKTDDEQAIVVTAESVSKALEVFKELDRKVASMPYDEDGEAGECMKTVYLTSKDKPKYVEDKPNDPEYLYYGSSKENVAIYKEVEKVYRHRAYHYCFPWEHSPYCKGASNIISALEEVLEEMTDPENEGYVFLFTWV